MMWRDVVQLVRLDYTVNDYGDQQYIRTASTVFANKKSVRQSEFYQALATGLKPEIMFEVRTLEYTGQENLVYNNKEYVIIRTYSKNDEITELVCSGLVVKGEGF
jgi:SPP1 family predicted phage head-tail adaptor